MSRLEDVVRETFAEYGDGAPDDATLLSVVRGRAVRRHRLRRLVAVLGVATALAAGGIAGRELGAADDNADVGQPGPLVTKGSCAGLSVTALKPPDIPLAYIRPGSKGNRVTMPGNSMILLQAQGPCVDRLRFRPDGFFLQGPAPTGDGNFTGEGDGGGGEAGIGLVVSHEHTGRTHIELYVDPQTRPLAVITVDITAPVFAPATLRASPSGS